MADYQPSSRRPIADIFRSTAHAVVRLCVRWNIHPDAVSYSSMVAAAAAGICFWQSGNVPALVIPRRDVLLPPPLAEYARRDGRPRFRQGEPARRTAQRAAGSHFGRSYLRRRRP